MKHISLSILLCLSVFIFSCKKSDNSPVTPPPQQKLISMSSYGWTLDSLYYKMWSDSSWQKYGQRIVINGITYVTIVNSAGTEYYYSNIGYAGFKPSGESRILFDRPISSLPDTLVFGQTYARETSFYYQGYNYSAKFENTLQDTVDVSIPLGIFNTCLWFSSKATLSAGGQSEAQSSQSWTAKGPSDIKQTLSSGGTIVMVRGRVSQHGWGMSFPKASSVASHNQFTLARAQLLNALFAGYRFNSHIN